MAARTLAARNRSNPNQTRVAGHQEHDGLNTSTSGQQGDKSHQESRAHNKHNNPGQSGHRPQQHEQEKH